MDFRKSFEAIIGVVVLLLCGLFFSHIFQKGKITKYEHYGYILYAKFNNIDGVSIGSEVKIAGIRVGTVEDIKLDKETFQAIVKIDIQKELKIPADSTISISSSGILGGKFVNLKIGIDDNILKNGEYFINTQSAVDFENLISKFVK